MSCLTVSDNSITVAKGLSVDHYDYSQHHVFEASVEVKSQERDIIADVVISSDSKYLALITTTSKKLIIYELPIMVKHNTFVLPRSASKISFMANNEQILVADKSGDALLYDIKEENSGTKLLGHLSLLLDILQTSDQKYIITSDRDEKIKVSCYPNTYNIHTYCLGHKEFVNHLELLPHNTKYLTSSSGDGQVKCWNYEHGTLSYNIDTFLDIEDNKLKEQFIKFMDNESVEVNTLPVVHYSVEKVSEDSSILAVGVHSFEKLLIYKLKSVNNNFTHSLIHKLSLNRFPAAIKLYKSNLYIYDDIDDMVYVYDIINEGESTSVKMNNTIKVFEDKKISEDMNKIQESIKVLYKRKFDNVQEYQERKRQRLEKMQ